MSDIMEKKIDLFYDDMNRLLKKYKFKEYCNIDDYNNIISLLCNELQNLLKNIFYNKILDIIGFKFEKCNSTVYVILVNKRTGQYIYNKADFKKAIEIPLEITFTIDLKSNEE